MCVYSPGFIFNRFYIRNRINGHENRGLFMNCEICGKKVNDSDIIKIDDLNYCQSCFDDIFSYCDDCDDVTERDQLTQVDNGNRVVCRYCLEEYYIRCNDCGEYYRGSDMSWYLDEYRLCQSCVDENYVTCES